MPTEQLPEPSKRPAAMLVLMVLAVMAMAVVVGVAVGASRAVLALLGVARVLMPTIRWVIVSVPMLVVVDVPMGLIRGVAVPLRVFAVALLGLGWSRCANRPRLLYRHARASRAYRLAHPMQGSRQPGCNRSRRNGPSGKIV
jgi:hypothetical protein